MSSQVSQQLMAHSGERHLRRVRILVSGMLGELAVVELLTFISIALEVQCYCWCELTLNGSL